MATIQVRDVPTEEYEVLRARARRSGQSLQAYMREQVVALARRPTKAQVAASIGILLAGTDPAPSRDEIRADLSADRR